MLNSHIQDSLGLGSFQVIKIITWRVLYMSLDIILRNYNIFINESLFP